MLASWCMHGSIWIFVGKETLGLVNLPLQCHDDLTSCSSLENFSYCFFEFSIKIGARIFYYNWLKNNFSEMHHSWNHRNVWNHLKQLDDKCSIICGVKRKKWVSYIDLLLITPHQQFSREVSFKFRKSWEEIFIVKGSTSKIF